MQVLARCLARQQADERRDLSAEVGYAVTTVRRLSCRLRVPRWFLVDVHAFAFCMCSDASHQATGRLTSGTWRGLLS
jgi:hypothetical protein